jgi:CheY-like chemotaxis protein
MQTIFIADDSELYRLMMRLAFEGHGYDVVAASDGQELLRRLDAQEADLIILDINMPGLSGIEVLERLEADPQLSRIPVLMASGQADRETRAKCMALGAREFHAKPCNMRSLTASVEQWLA